MPHDPPAAQREFPPVATQRRRWRRWRCKTLRFEVENNSRIYVTVGESAETPWQKEQGPKVRTDRGTKMKDDERNGNTRTSKDKNIQNHTNRHKKKTKAPEVCSSSQNSVQESFQGFAILLTASGHLEHLRWFEAVSCFEALTYDLLPFQSQLGRSSKLIPTWCHRCLWVSLMTSPAWHDQKPPKDFVFIFWWENHENGKK